MVDAAHVPSVPVVSVHDDTAAWSLRSHEMRTVEATMLASPAPVETVRSFRNRVTSELTVPTCLLMYGISAHPVPVEDTAHALPVEGGWVAKSNHRVGRARDGDRESRRRDDRSVAHQNRGGDRARDRL